MKTKAVQYFEESRYNSVFNRTERNITVGLQLESGIYFQTIRLPEDSPMTEEQIKNGLQLIFNLNK